MRRSWGLTARGRAAVVGDAAGLVDPLSGDGMFEAILSSKLASEAALDVLAGRAPGMEPYAGRLRRALAGHVATAWTAKIAARAGARPHLAGPPHADHAPLRGGAPEPLPAPAGPRQRDARALGPPRAGGARPLATAPRRASGRDTG